MDTSARPKQTKHEPRVLTTREGEWRRQRSRGFLFERRGVTGRDAVLRRMLAIADAGTALLVSIALAVFPGGNIDVAFWAAACVPAWVFLAKLHGLYDRDHRALRHLTVDELPALLVWALTGTAGMTFVLALSPAGTPGLAALVGAWAVAVAAAVLLRSFTRFLWRRIVPRERTLIVGTGPLADATRRKLELFPDIHVEVIDQREETPDDPAYDPGTMLFGVDRVILAAQSIDEEMIADILSACRDERVKLSVIPPARGMFGTAVRLNHVADLPVIEYNTWDVSRSTLLLKRVMDVSLAATALVCLAPLFAVIAAAIAVESRGPVIFRQVRAGQNGRPFRMLKFRTMVADAEARLPQLVPFDSLADPMFKLRCDPRVTRVGRVLRRTSLDELPQLVNVVLGSMSLVGPRPEQLDLADRYRPEHRFRLLVRPGITGPMQVYGRGELTFEERLAVEREYIENLSLARDFRILGLTVPTALIGRGAF